MASTTSQIIPPPSAESKSARKKKVKAETSASNGTAAVPPVTMPAVPSAPTKEDTSSLDPKEGLENGQGEHPYVRELHKHMRNLHKKLAGLQKTEAVVAESGPGVTLEQLVKERKINADQRASLQKKPQLEAQLAALEEQVAQYKKFDAEHQVQLLKQREELTAVHEAELEKAREDARMVGVTNSAEELRKKLLVFSQFLRCAAAKRMVEEDKSVEENKAFEGVLLLVYGGDEQAVQATMDLIEGKDERIWSVDGVLLDVTFAHVKAASLAHAPFQIEESWVDSVAEANATGTPVPAESDPSIPPGTDPTIAYAGLTELDTTAGEPNGVHGVGGEDPLTSPPQADAGDAAGNAAGDKWDPNDPVAERALMEEDYEMVPRPQDELETPVAGGAAAAAAALQAGKMSWADDHPSQPPAYDTAMATGNQAGESWDIKAAGAGDGADEAFGGVEAAAQAGVEGYVEGGANPASSAVPAGEDADGFHQVAGRHHRGRGRGRGFDGNFRGGGGGFRGRGDRGGFRGEGGELRGRGRGGFRGRGEGGEFRGRGRGRGPRGGAAEGQTRGS